MTLFESNMAALKAHYPALAERVSNMPDKASLRVLRARDGGVAYGLVRNGQIQPITDPVAPLARIQAQLDQWSSQLADHTRPVLVIGLYPGNELLTIFDQVEAIQTPHCAQPIWVCLDSTIGLYGFLNTWDAVRVLASPRVRWFWHDEIGAQVDWLRAHPEFPHLFTLISGASERTLNLVMPPVAALIEQRQSEVELLKADNERYYDALSDQELAGLLAVSPQAKGGRRPRLMMPTVTWSTFVQHSTRDTARAFEALGWEVQVLKLEAMLTPYYLVKSIHEFKPDVFLFIDHMRYEAEEVYPRNMMYVTWIQDEMPNLQCRKAGEKMCDYAARGNRDLVLGYVEGLEAKYSFPKERLVPLMIPADPHLFHPVPLSTADQVKYGCDLAFMTNTSMASEQVVEEKIRAQVEPLGVSWATCRKIHDDLWSLYRAGRTLTDRQEFTAWLGGYPEIAEIWRDRQLATQQDDIWRLFYWRLNDTIYRHVVLEWADELGLDMHLYGQGWQNHPRFSRYARAPLAHGADLNTAYQAARRCLHLNIAQGIHQRLHEISASGANLLLRSRISRAPVAGEPPRDVMVRLATAFRIQGGSSAGASLNFDPLRPDICTTPVESAALTDWLFNLARFHFQQESSSAASLSLEYFEQNILKLMGAALEVRLDWNLDNWAEHVFFSREEFSVALR